MGDLVIGWYEVAFSGFGRFGLRTLALHGARGVRDCAGYTSTKTTTNLWWGLGGWGGEGWGAIIKNYKGLQ